MLSELTQAVIIELTTPNDRSRTYVPWWLNTDDGLNATMHDVANNGADGGTHGFTYYTETTAFYDAHENAIWDALYNDAANLGQTPMQMIASFATADQITDALTFKNALAWYALERAAIEWEWAADDAAIA